MTPEKIANIRNILDKIWANKTKLQEMQKAWERGDYSEAERIKSEQIAGTSLADLYSELETAYGSDW